MDRARNLKQFSLGVADCMSRFDGLMMHCNLQEEPIATLTSFINGFNADIKRDAKLHSPKALKEACLRDGLKSMSTGLHPIGIKLP